MKKIIIGIMVGLIISCTVGALAASIVPSTIVTYQDKTVNMALDELYDNVNLLKTKGNAEANQILTGKKVIVKGQEITGTMANRGKLNWNPSSSTTYTVPAGYYSGGTISSSNAYSKGVTDADNRANTSSVNYKTGYNNGYKNGKTTNYVVKQGSVDVGAADEDFHTITINTGLSSISYYQVKGYVPGNDNGNANNITSSSVSGGRITVRVYTRQYCSNMVDYLAVGK